MLSVLALRRRRTVSLPLLLGWVPLLAMDAAVLRGVVFTGERQLYLASAGWAWLGGWGAAAALPPATVRSARLARLAAAVVVVAWLGLAGWQTWSGLAGWRDEPSMYLAMQRAQPRNAMGWIGAALCAIRANQAVEARRDLERAEALEPTRAEIPLLRAGLALREGRAAEALVLARAASAGLSWDRDAALLEVLALQRLERWREASPLVERLHGRLPADEGVEAAWARQALAEGRFPEVTAELERRPPRPGEDGGLQEMLGEAHARLGEWSAARAAFARSLQIQPARYEAWLGLAAASELAGDLAGARAALERAGQLPGAADGRAARMRERLAGGAR